MTDAVFDWFCISLALVTAAFAALALVWIQWDRKAWQEWKRRHIIGDCPPDLDTLE